MELGNFNQDGLMDQHISLNALFKQVKAMFTITQLKVKEAHSFIMLTYLG
jgi:hypothetical protein